MHYEESGAIGVAFSQIIEANVWESRVPTLSALPVNERELRLEELVGNLATILSEHGQKMSATSLVETAVARYRIMEDDGSRALSRLLSSGIARFTSEAEIELSHTQA